MRFFLVFALCVAFVAATEPDRVRKKRFVKPRNWAFLPERSLRLPDHHFDMTRGLSGLSSIARELDPLGVLPISSLFGPSRRQDQPIFRTNTTPKKGPNTEREMEDPDDDVETVNAKEVFVDPPKREEPGKRKGTDDREVSLFNPFGLNPMTFTFGIFTPWWKGPNVCVERSEIDESQPDDDSSGGFLINFEATQCSPTETTYTCTKKIRNKGVRKTMIIKHQCCHGFAKRTDGKPGCIEVSMDDTMETMKALDAAKFADMFEQTGMGEKLKEENFTIFAPANEAIVDFEEESENNEIMNARPPKDHSHLVGGHIVDGLVNLDSVQNEDILPAINGKTTIRVNKYRQMMQTVITANCVPVSSKNNMATNGIVHIMSNILPMPRKTVADIITASPKLSVFSKLLENSGDLLTDLEDTKKSWTLFVPTDKAFESLGAETMQKLLTGEGCVESVLKNHLVKGTYCSRAITNRFRVMNALNKILTINREDVQKLKVNDITISHTDLLGTNGVVHFIDDVIMPPEAQSTMEVLKKSNRDDLIELIKQADLESMFDSMQNVTFFAPSKDAIKAVPEDLKEEWKSKPEKLKEVLLYHVVAPQVPASSFKHNQELASLAEDRSIRMQLHDVFPGISVAATAQCSLVVNHDNKVCGAVLHVIDKMILPPKRSIMDELRQMEDQKTLVKLLESTDLESKLSNEGEGPYTLLAPTDKAFERFDKDSLQELFENKTMAEQVLRMHILPEALCCSAVTHSFPIRLHYVRTLEGNLLSLHRNVRNDRVTFGSSKAVHCDQTTRNGLIHKVDRVLLPTKRPYPSIIPSLFDMDILSGLF